MGFRELGVERPLGARRVMVVFVGTSLRRLALPVRFSEVLVGWDSM